ncbi:MAG TPA: FkbM family methyltransferase [Candidatus Baltobacteraceae bacterium]|jgi:FkbM family methyltransferase|nr:FkbM family methyltransferase [Candidatus Baltobacteraceae bacterium]
MKRHLRSAADRIQRLIARSPLLVRAAVLVRNQCRCIIKYHLAESPDVNETGEVWLRRAIAPRASTFMDVGANVGEWLAEIAALKAGSEFRAVAYEPSNSAFAKLSERFAGNPQVTLRNCAAGDRAADLEFFEEERAGKGSSLVSDFVAAAGRKRIVQAVRLDDEIATLGWEHVDLLKIDAEGYDMRVMAGAQRLFEQQRIGAVQFEYNRAWQLAGDTLYAAMRFLEQRGYEVFVLKRDGLYTLNYNVYEEFFEYANFVALAPEFASIKEQSFRGTI